MSAIYLQRWTSALGASPHDADGKLTVGGDTWARGLAGLTGDQLGRGLEACSSTAEDWPPTLPQFRALCLAIPSLGAVREDLRRAHEEREPFTVMVYRRLDGWAYRHAEARHADRMLVEAYNDAYEAVMRGEPLPVRLVAVESKPAPPKRASPEVATAAKAQIHTILNGETP